MATPDDPLAIGSAELFPGSNPHPVMRVTDDGRLLYANEASVPLIETMGARIGERLSPEWQVRLAACATSATPVELKVGPRTFELLVVHLPELGFINVYGTDVTAARAIVKFPDQNPNPVFRITWDGTLVYANPASLQLVEGSGWTMNAPLPRAVLEPLLAGASADAGSRRTVEVVSEARRYRLLPVDVPEFEFINVYGTDVTAGHQLEAAHEEIERLLLNILPEPVAARLRRGERPIADRFEDVSLLFADIVGFTSLSGGMGADRLVSVLDEVFSVFDELVDAEGLEKVKTIGDAYMVVGGMSEDTPDHLERLARVSLGLGERLVEIETVRQLGIEFRIGIHCGPVVAGVIGTRKFIYDVWGDTVNIASRMESTGVPGRIQVTAAVEERLRHAFEFEARGLTEIRGKGPMPTYFLIGAIGTSPARASGTVHA
jgi:class 3 adenylate cyclase